MDPGAYLFDKLNTTYEGLQLVKSGNYQNLVVSALKDARFTYAFGLEYIPIRDGILTDDQMFAIIEKLGNIAYVESVVDALRRTVVLEATDFLWAPEINDRIKNS